MKRKQKKHSVDNPNVRKAYAISLGNNDFYEENVAGELLLFDNYEQIAEYSIVNNINFESISVHEFLVEELPDDNSMYPEIEF